MQTEYVVVMEVVGRRGKGKISMTMPARDNAEAEQKALDYMHRNIRVVSSANRAYGTKHKIDLDLK